MSFLKYQSDIELTRGNGRGPLSWNRAHIDGTPWRGPSMPLREAEYQDYTEEVQDFEVGVFDVRDPVEHAQLQEIMDRAVNGWYRLVDYDKKWVQTDKGYTMLVYVAYTAPYRELAKNRTLAELLPTTVPALSLPQG